MNILMLLVMMLLGTWALDGLFSWSNPPIRWLPAPDY